MNGVSTLTRDLARPVARRRLLNNALGVFGMLGDVLAINVSMVLAFWVRFHSGWLAVPKGQPATLGGYYGAMVAATLVWLVVFGWLGLYRPQPWTGPLDEAYRVLVGAAGVVVCLMAMSFLYRNFEYSRLTVLLAFVITLGVVIALRIVGLKVCNALARQPGSRPRVAVLGAAEVREVLGADREVVLSEDAGADVYERLLTMVTAGELDEIILSRHLLAHDQLLALCRAAEVAGASVVVVADPVDLLLARGGREDVAGLSLVRLRDVPLSGVQRGLKRAFDLVGAALALVLCGWLLLLVGWLVKRGSPGPALLRQTRVTEGGREFTLFKFRTMYVDAEARTGAVWTQRNDPRVTPIGRLLRRTSVDELPQLLNILRGDMSLIGPRPERPAFVEQFAREIPRYSDRHRMPTGLTGWAQVNGERGSDSDIVRRTRYDLFYVDNWSLMLDFQILIKTLFEVLFHRGAY